MFFLVELLKYIPELFLGFKMSARKGRKGYDKPSQKVTRYMYSLVAKQCPINVKTTKPNPGKVYG